MNKGITKSVITVKGLACISDEETEMYIDEYKSDLMILDDDNVLMNIKHCGAVNLISYIQSYADDNYVTKMTVKSVTGLTLEETMNIFKVRAVWYSEQSIDEKENKKYTNLTVINPRIPGWESVLINAILFNNIYNCDEGIPIYVEIYMESN